MSDSSRWSVQGQIEWFRCQFAQHARLPFADVLPAQVVIESLRSLGVRYYESTYNPVTVLWLFLSQVMHANPTLAAPVENFLAWRLGQGLPPCSTDTTADSRSRIRLPEALLSRLTRHTGREAEQSAVSEWRWQGRVVKLFDGSTVSRPDTPENQAAYPQPTQQKPGVGFPRARGGVLFSLSVRTVLELGIRRWAGKLQSELAMLRDMLDTFDADDVLVTDRNLCSYREIAMLRGRGVEVVARRPAQRNVDFRKGRQLGRDEHVVEWIKPPRPEWMPPSQDTAIPERLTIREIRRRSVRKGYRTRTVVIATTLLDGEAFPPDGAASSEIARVYRLRWDAEINLRSLKTMMPMDVLRCKTPEMVRKEIWAHLLAYNLIRTVMAQAALRHGKDPRHIRFTRALRTLESFRTTLAHASGQQLVTLYEHLLTAIASQEIGNRPNRLEPRQRKRRPKPYKLMTQPRAKARRQERRTR